MKRFNLLSQAVLPVAGAARFALGQNAATKRKTMQRRWFSVASSVLLAICAMAMSLVPKAWADTVVHDFAGGADGAVAYGTLGKDAWGNLYGTTWGGGTSTFGTVFVQCNPVPPPFSPPPCGAAGEHILHPFAGVGGNDGANPTGNLLVGKYTGGIFIAGTTVNGGLSSTCGGAGCGTVFLMKCPTGCTSWTYQVIYNFLGAPTDGANPYAGVIVVKDGTGATLAGTTYNGGNSTNCGGSGGAAGCGTVFLLNSHTGWHESMLYNFTNSPDGAHPYAGLNTSAAQKNEYLIGTTVVGGNADYGTVFEVKIGSGAEHVLYRFCPSGNCTGGANPYASVVFDAHGNLYGTAAEGGNSTELGVVFKLAAPALTAESVRYTFCSLPACADGSFPLAELRWDNASPPNLYGTTWGGGTVACTGGCGTVFQLASPYTQVNLTTLWSFLGGATDGANPWGGLIFDPPWLPLAHLRGVTTGAGLGNGVLYSNPD